MIETTGAELKRLPVLPLRGLTAFPQMIIHFDVGTSTIPVTVI